jgi:hypothetical protein
MAAAGHKAYVNTHVEMTLGSAGNVEGFMTCSTPKGTLNIPKGKAWNAQGAPDNVQTTSTVDWSPITATRLHTEQAFNPLWTAWKKGVDTPDTAKEDYKLVEKSKDGKILATWNLKGAYLKSVESSDHDANGHDLKKLTITIEYDDAELT